jgi:L-amino acid N-acyltransferase YncA
LRAARFAGSKGARRMDIVIRSAGPADIGQITEIYADAVLTGTATFETEAPTTAEMLQRFELLHASRHPYLVAVSAERVVGYAYAGPYRVRPAYRFTVEDSIYLHAEARGKGIGGKLLHALVMEAEGRGFREMVAVIGDSDNAASVAVHRKAGFSPVGTLRGVGFKFDRWLDTVLMQRNLRPE